MTDPVILPSLPPQTAPHLRGEEMLDGTFQSWLTKPFTKVLDVVRASFKEFEVSLIEYNFISVKLATFYCWMNWAARGKCHWKVRGWEGVRMQSQLILLRPEPILFSSCLYALSSRRETKQSISAWWHVSLSDCSARADNSSQANLLIWREKMVSSVLR